MLNPTVTMDDFRSLSYAAFATIPFGSVSHAHSHSHTLRAPAFAPHPQRHPSSRVLLVGARISTSPISVVGVSSDRDPSSDSVPSSCSRRATCETCEFSTMDARQKRTISSERGERLERLGAVHDGVAHARRTHAHVGARRRSDIRGVGGGVFTVHDGAREGAATGGAGCDDGFCRRSMRGAHARGGGRGARRRRGHDGGGGGRGRGRPGTDRACGRRACVRASRG